MKTDTKVKQERGPAGDEDETVPMVPANFDAIKFPDDPPRILKAPVALCLNSRLSWHVVWCVSHIGVPRMRYPSNSLLQVTRREQLGLKEADPDPNEPTAEAAYARAKAKAHAKAKGKARAKAKTKAKAAPNAKAPPEAKAKVRAKAKARQSGNGDALADEVKEDAPHDAGEGGGADDGGSASNQPVETNLRRLRAVSNLEEVDEPERRKPPAKSKRPEDGADAQDGEPASKRGRRPPGEAPTSFARRVEPANPLGSMKWRSIREAFNILIKPHLVHYSAHEAGACVRVVG